MTWLLTWSTYGTRLPGDARGFVSRLRTDTGGTVIHNQPGTPVDADIPALRRYAESIMTQPATLLTAEQAGVVAEQFRETAAYRRWPLHAIAVMADHVHLVVDAPDAITSAKLLTDFKAYSTRRLDRDFGGGMKRRWWTERGSTRALKHADAVAAAVAYVKNQHEPLVVWLPDDNASGGA
jgi:REP element-mobilizing transposase RayT